MKIDFNLRKVVLLIGCILTACVIVAIPLSLLSNASNKTLDYIEVPLNWDKSYVEDATAYEEYNQKFATWDWSTYKPEETDTFTTYTVFNTESDMEFEERSFNTYERIELDIETYTTTNIDISKHDAEIAMLPENEAWDYISNGLWTSYPKGSFASNLDKLQKLKENNTETITVKCWYWKDPKDPYNLEKTTVTKVFAVNSKLARTFEHIFDDIYKHPSKPVINIGDGGMGTWVLRGKNHKASNTMSAHSLGVAIDINPSTGSFYVNGAWYGNAYGQKVMPETIWKQLPNVQKKYHVLYDGCPIVEIFKSYGFYWGGDWSSTKDAMHLSYIGDGSTARETGIKNYLERK